MWKSEGMGWKQHACFKLRTELVESSREVTFFQGHEGQGAPLPRPHVIPANIGDISVKQRARSCKALRAVQESCPGSTRCSGEHPARVSVTSRFVPAGGGGAATRERCAIECRKRPPPTLPTLLLFIASSTRWSRLPRVYALDSTADLQES